VRGDCKSVQKINYNGFEFSNTSQVKHRFSLTAHHKFTHNDILLLRMTRYIYVSLPFALKNQRFLYIQRNFCPIVFNSVLVIISQIIKTQAVFTGINYPYQLLL